MSTIDELATMQTPDPIEATSELAILLNLPSVDLTILGARFFGQGSRATVEVDVSNGETMTWDTVRDMTRPANLAAEVVACTGACPSLKQPQAFHVVSLVRMIAEHERTFTDNQIAADWGASYLQAADVLDVDMNDQRQRWTGFDRINQYPVLEWPTGLVLRHTNDTRFVRCGWFLDWVRRTDTTVGQATLSIRMSRVGWTRRGNSGRIKATAPDRPQTLAWNFWTVPPAWEHDQ